MKIKYAKLEDFQAHEKRLIKFSPNITTIIGASDRGKSAIIRALGWVCLNNFAGAEFVKRDAKQAAVTIKVVERGTAHLITRTRSASGALNTYECDGDEFKSFGQNVPDGIDSLLRLSPINFQCQHDSPFWFSETAGEVSRQLNAIIDLSVIDSSLSYVAKLVRDKETRLTICDERTSKLESELEKLEPQRKRIDEFKKLEAAKARHDKVEANRDRLGTLIGKIRTSRVKDFRRRRDEGSRVLERGRLAMASRERVDALRSLYGKARSLESETIPPPDFAAVVSLRALAAEATPRRDRLLALIHRAELHRWKLKEQTETKLAAEKLFHSETDGRPCPICGNTL